MKIIRNKKVLVNVKPSYDYQDIKRSDNFIMDETGKYFLKYVGTDEGKDNFNWIENHREGATVFTPNQAIELIKKIQGTKPVNARSIIKKWMDEWALNAEKKENKNANRNT